MTPQSAADMINRHGETVILRRPNGSGGYVDATVKARSRFYKPVELVNGIVQGDREVVVAAATLAAAGWPVPPVKGDVVAIDRKHTAVQGCATAKVGEEPALYRMQVRG